METVLFHEEANSKSKSLNKSRLGETAVLAHAKPLTVHPSCNPGSTSVLGQSWWPCPSTAIPCPLHSPCPQSAWQSPCDWEQPWQLWAWRERRSLGAALVSLCPRTPLSGGDSHKISRTVFPLQTPWLLFFLQTQVHLRFPKRWTRGDVCITLKKAFVCLLLTGSGNCQEIIVKTLCCFSLSAPIISEQPHQLKSDQSSQSSGEWGSYSFRTNVLDSRGSYLLH